MTNDPNKVDALDLAKLVNSWKRNHKLKDCTSEEAKMFCRGYHEAVDGMVRLLRDAEARSTISVSGYIR